MYEIIWLKISKILIFSPNSLYKIELKIYPKEPYIKKISFINFSPLFIWYGMYASLEKSINIFPHLPK